MPRLQFWRARAAALYTRAAPWIHATCPRWNIVDVLWFAIMLTAVTMRLLYFTNPLRVEFSIFNLDYQVTQSGGG